MLKMYLNILIMIIKYSKWNIKYDDNIKFMIIKVKLFIFMINVVWNSRSILKCGTS